MKKIAVIIPALNPDPRLVPYVEELLSRTFSSIIIVNDGSTSVHRPIFEELEQRGCVVLTRHENKGKGQALKTAFRYVLEQTDDDIVGVVTADADGQHAVQDVYSIAHMLKTNPDHLVLGTRLFDAENVPLRSMLGNKLTSFVFYLLYGRNLIDTQTGLRGIAKSNLEWLIKLKGDRYEYEINMLIHAIRRNIAIQEHRIETIYLNENASSYYKTIVDSLKIVRRIISGFMRKRMSKSEKQEYISEDGY